MMTKADLFSLALKVMGVYLIVPFLNAIVQFILQLTTLISLQTTGYDDYIESSYGNYFLVIGYGLVPACIYAVCAWFLLTKSTYLTKKILPEAEHTDRVAFGLNAEVVFQLSFVIAGIILLLQGLPITVNNIYQYFVQLNTNGNPGMGDLGFDTISTTFFGLLCIAYSAVFARFLSRRRSSKPTTPENEGSTE